jgi:hypothetical protein
MLSAESDMIFFALISAGYKKVNLLCPAETLISPSKHTLDLPGWHHHAAVPGLLSCQHLKEVGAQETGRWYVDPFLSVHHPMQHKFELNF